MYALVAVAIVVAYFPILSNGFIRLDDPLYITENAFVLSGMSGQGVKGALTEVVAANWHPVTMLSHVVDVTLFGVNPGAHHAVNLLLHVINAFLLGWLTGRMTKSTWAGVIAMALWGLHPINVEPVAWASSRKDMLSMLFVMLTLVFYYMKVTTGKSRFYGLSVAACVLALLSKPTAVTLPVLMLLMDYWPLGRLEQQEELKVRRPWVDLVKEKWLFFTLAAGAAAMTFFVQRGAGAMPDAPGLSLWGRMGSACVAYCHTLGHWVWPRSLGLLYPHPGAWPPGVVAGCFGFLAVMSVALLALHKKESVKPFAMGWFWFLIAMAPMSGIVLVGSAYMADRYAYIPMVGLVMAFSSWSGGWMTRMSGPSKFALIGVKVGAVVVLGVLTHVQAKTWRSSITAFEQALKAAPVNPIASYNLGVEYARAERYAEAEAVLEEGLRHAPGFQLGLLNLGHVRAMTGQVEKAGEAYGAYLDESSQELPQIMTVMKALAESGKGEVAREVLRATVKSPAKKAEGFKGRAQVLDQMGDAAGALGMLEGYLKESPRDVGVLLRAASLSFGLGKVDEAKGFLERVLEIEPGNAKAKAGLDKIQGAGKGL